MCFNHTAILTTDGVIISSLDEFAAFTIALATVLELRDVGEYFGIFSKVLISTQKPVPERFQVILHLTSQNVPEA